MMELDVIGAAILKRHAMLEGQLLDPQGCLRGILQLAEAPLVWIRDVIERIGADHSIGQVRPRRSLVNFLVRDEQLTPHQCLIETRAHQAIIMILVVPVDLAVKFPLLSKEKTARVAKRACDDLPVLELESSFVFRILFLDIRIFTWILWGGFFKHTKDFSPEAFEEQ